MTSYNNIVLPKRASSGSAGYDFYSTIDFELKPGESIKIPTGIRCYIDEGFFLMIAPRSSMGFKCRMQLDNTAGIIDSDYYNSDNEGHIMIKVTNDSKSNKALSVKTGDRFAREFFFHIIWPKKKKT